MNARYTKQHQSAGVVVQQGSCSISLLKGLVSFNPSTIVT